MDKSFRYKGCVGFVRFPPDDFTKEQALKMVRQDIDALIKIYGKKDLPKENTGENGLVIWNWKRYERKTQ